MTTTLSAKNPNDIAAFACIAVGFLPAESFVMMAVDGTGMTARVDLCSYDPSLPVEAVLKAAKGNDVKQVALAIFTETREIGVATIEYAIQAFKDAEIDARVTILACDGAWTSYEDDLPVASGVLDLQAHPFMTRVHAETGRTVRASRSLLVADLEPRDVIDPLDVQAPAPEGDVATIKQIHATFQECIDQRRAMTHEELVIFLANLEPGSTRDGINAFATRVAHPAGILPGLCDVLIDAVRRSPRYYRKTAASMLALAQYTRGDGAAAWVAIDESRLIGECSLAELIAQLLEQAMPPKQFIEMWNTAVEPDGKF